MLRLKMTVDVLFKIKVFVEIHHSAISKGAFSSSFPISQNLCFVPFCFLNVCIRGFFTRDAIWGFHASFNAWSFLLVCVWLYYYVKGFLLMRTRNSVCETSGHFFTCKGGK